MEKKYQDLPVSSTIVSLDLETTGAYPVSWEICEIGAIKWTKGKVIDRWSQLVRPRGEMNPIAQNIHKISLNELQDKPFIEEVLPSFKEFIKDCWIVAHHAPFDLGFLAYEFQKASLEPPAVEPFCTSLITRQLFPKLQSYRLSYLSSHFKLDQTHKNYHRSDFDSEMALFIFLESIKALEPHKYTLEELHQKLAELQNTNLSWNRFLPKNIAHWPQIEGAIQNKKQLVVEYKSKERSLFPCGLVRNPSGDYLVSQFPEEEKPKRFYLDKLKVL